MNYRKIKIPIYFGNLILIEKTDYKEVYKKLNLEGHELESPAMAFKEPTKNNLTQYVIVFDLKQTGGSVMAHESFHVLSEIARDRGFDNFNNEEPLAYLMGWIYRQFNDFIQKLNENN